MEKSVALKFESPGFSERLKGMLGVDFYRLFHTPLYYIFLAIAAIIPAMVLSMGETPDGGASMYTNTWQMVAGLTPTYVISNIGEYANMNMVYIFGGIMISIFIGHDYRSGYVKQLFTTHAKKRDYMLSKSLTGAFSMACMCITYLGGTIIAGLISGADFSVNAGSLLLAILGKIVMSFGWASLYALINIVLRRFFGYAIAGSFLLGTGIPIIGAAAVLGENATLNVFLYGSSVYACLNASLQNLIVCAAVSLAWMLVYNLIGALVLSRCDVY